MKTRLLSVFVAFALVFGLSFSFAYADNEDIINEDEITEVEEIIDENSEDIIEEDEVITEEENVTKNKIIVEEENVNDYPVMTLASNYQGITPMTGSVYIDAHPDKGGTPASAGTFTYQFEFDSSKSTNTESDPTNGKIFEIENGNNGSIEIPLMDYKWGSDTGTYVYKITQLPTKGYEPLITNQDKYGYDFFPNPQYIHIDTSFMYNAGGKWFQQIEKPGSAYKSSSLMFVNTKLPPVMSKLTVTKVIQNSDAEYDHETEFNFKIKIGDNEPQEFTLKEGGTWESKEYEEGTKFAIVEYDLPDHFAFVGTDINNYEKANDSISLEGTFQDQDILITYTNKYVTPPPPPPSNEDGNENKNNNDNTEPEDEILSDSQETEEPQELIFEHVLAQTGDNIPIIPIVGGIIFCALAIGMLIFVRRSN